jgi:hypothetical protein
VIALAAAVLALLLGWSVVRLLAPERWPGPGWIRWLVDVSLAVGLGTGITSCLFFVLVWVGILNRGLLWGCELAALGGALFLLFRRKREPHPPVQAQANSPWIWILRAAAVLALCTFVLDFSEETSANPNGEYDAVTIWNLRARYLSGGTDTWRYSVSAQMAAGMTGASHPGYPLLNSAFIARTWVMAEDNSASVPAGLSLVFTLATLGLLAGAVASASSEILGLLAVLVLLATEAFVSQASFQYADIPLSFYILAASAVLATAAGRRWPPGLIVLAGLFAGLAAWTKNEGLPFALLACLVVVWRAGVRSGAWMAVGAAPGAVLTLALKFWLATGGEKMFPNGAGEAIRLVADPSRWIEIVRSFATNLGQLGALWWAHPLLLLAILAFALGFVSSEERRSRLWLLAPLAGLLAADFGIYLISTTGLGWHLSTSNNRLIVQVWPAFLFAFSLILRPPALAQPASAPEPKAREKRRQPTHR